MYQLNETEVWREAPPRVVARGRERASCPAPEDEASREGSPVPERVSRPHIRSPCTPPCGWRGTGVRREDLAESPATTGGVPEPPRLCRGGAALDARRLRRELRAAGYAQEPLRPNQPVSPQPEHRAHRLTAPKPVRRSSPNHLVRGRPALPPAPSTKGLGENSSFARCPRQRQRQRRSLR
jgi:hypothetical protein